MNSSVAQLFLLFLVDDARKFATQRKTFKKHLGIPEYNVVSLARYSDQLPISGNSQYFFRDNREYFFVFPVTLFCIRFCVCVCVKQYIPAYNKIDFI